MSYWQLFYHIIFTTKDRLPLLTPQVEPVIHEMLRTKAVGLEATVFALNGTADHVHLVAAIPPKIAISTFIGQIKATASTRFNKSTTGSQWPFFWQEEYGVFSFDGKRLPNYIAYVQRQKEHHVQHTAIPVLERVGDGDVRRVHEESTIYAVEDANWRIEFEALEG